MIAASLASAFFVFQLALMLPATWGLMALTMGGFCLLSSAPVSIALAQRYAPASAATVSSLMLGMGWGTGGLLVPLVGMLADHLGLIWALRVEGLSLIAAAVLALRLPPAAKP